MCQILRDPSLPPGEIVEKRSDGTWVRNDSVELRPAGENPFYVLATVYAEHEGQLDNVLAARNRRIWNGWACAEMSDQERQDLASALEIDVAELAVLEDEEMRDLHQAFNYRLGRDFGLPRNIDVIADFSKTYFDRPIMFDGYVFPAVAAFDSSYFAKTSFVGAHIFQYCDFMKSHFGGGVDFSKAVFRGVAMMSYAHFRGARFDDARFFSDADFPNAFFESASFRATCFSGIAEFKSAKFHRHCNFRAAEFYERAEFNDAFFGGQTVFSDGRFAAPADFDGAHFASRVPDFFQRDFHDNTRFTPQLGNWPPVLPRYAAMFKDNYRRLRQVSAAQHNPENEHFFLRQEMACSAVLQEDLLGSWAIKGFGAISDFGYSIARPLVGLVGVIVLFWLAFLMAFAWEAVYHDGVRSGAEAFGLSFSNTFAFLGFNRVYFGTTYFQYLPAWIKVAGAVQTILGVILLFFLGLGLRNRFRLK